MALLSFINPKINSGVVARLTTEFADSGVAATIKRDAHHIPRVCIRTNDKPAAQKLLRKFNFSG